MGLVKLLCPSTVGTTAVKTMPKAGFVCDNGFEPLKETRKQRASRRRGMLPHPFRFNEEIHAKKYAVVEAIATGADPKEVAKTYDVPLAAVRKWTRAAEWREYALARKRDAVARGELAERLDILSFSSIERGLISKEGYNEGRIGLNWQKGRGMLKQDVLPAPPAVLIFANMTDAQLDRAIEISARASAPLALAERVENCDALAQSASGNSENPAGCLVVVAERDEDVQPALAGSGV